MRVLLVLTTQRAERFLYLSLLQFARICGVCALLAATAGAQEISPAEKLLFETNHMQGLDAPVTLTYSYNKKADAEAGFDDEVRVSVTRINPDKSAAVSVHFLSDDRNVPVPDIDQAEGNPVLLGFLERDIVEMKRLTGGSTYYFRKRIRLALASTKEVRPVRFVYAGKERQGQEVRIQPYLDDPMRERFPAYETKSYIFTLSEDVPGRLYRIRSSSTESATKKQGGIVETLTLVGEKH